jgi:hypothetical protein
LDVQKANSRFGEWLRTARERGPQTIAIEGKVELVVLTKEAFETTVARKRPKTWDELYAPARGPDPELPPCEIEPERVIDFSED